MSKNIEMNYKIDSGYEVIYPSTQSSNIIIQTEYGNNLEDIINNIGKKADTANSKFSPELIGTYVIRDTQSATFSITVGYPLYFLYADINQSTLVGGNTTMSFTGSGGTFLLNVGDSSYTLLTTRYNFNATTINTTTVTLSTYYAGNINVSVYGLRFF